MRLRQLVCGALALSSLACGDDDGPSRVVSFDAGLDAGSEAGARDGASDAGDGALSDARVDGSFDAGDLDALVPTSDARADAQPALPVPPRLVGATLRRAGRFGDDLALELTGAVTERTIVAVRVELYSAQQTQLGSALIVPLPRLITASEMSSTALLRGVFSDYPELAKARVTLLDEVGQQSAAASVDILRPDAVARGAACDPTFTLSRCEDADGCTGTPPTCQMGSAPVLTRAAFYDDALGARLLLQGSDVDANATSFTLRFFDASDAPVAVDLDGDPLTAPESSWEGALDPVGTIPFAQRISPPALPEAVASIRVSVHDEGDLTSNELTTARMAAPLRALAESCDPQGFDRCDVGAVCQQQGAAYRCAGRDDARTSACESALVLDPGAGVNTVRGSTHGSLWEPPTGCVDSASQRPDRVVKLVLTSAAERVVLTTDLPYTGFGSALYLLTECTAAPVLARCAVGQPAPASDRAELRVSNLAAGTYYVVVDGSRAVSGLSDTFELSVAVERSVIVE